jgi:hypothetical protein
MEQGDETGNSPDLAVAAGVGDPDARWPRRSIAWRLGRLASCLLVGGGGATRYGCVSLNSLASSPTAKAVIAWAEHDNTSVMINRRVTHDQGNLRISGRGCVGCCLCFARTGASFSNAGCGSTGDAC